MSLPKPYYESELGRLYHADCLEILPHIEPVDLVLKNGLTNNTKNATINYEEKQARTIQDGRGAGFVGATQRGNQVALPRTAMVDGTNSKIFQHIPNGDGEGFAEVENQFAGSWKTGGGERTIQEWETESSLSSNDRERQMLKLREDDGPCGSPQERGPLRQPPGEPSDTLRELPFELPQKDVVGSTGNQEIVCITDPPYNFEACGGGFYGVKWHGLTSEPREYLSKLKDINCVDFDPDVFLSLLPTKYCYFFCNKTLISKYILYAEKENLLYDLLVMHKRNPIPAKNNHYLHDLEYIVMVRPKSSFFYCDEYNLMSKLYSTVVGNGKLHPAEKPLGIIEKFIKVSCSNTGTVLDPFLGSGTTAVACERLKRKWIGIEISEEYCAIAVKRIEAERRQLKLF